MALDFYDRPGNPISYSDDGENIYLFSGEPVAFLDGDAVYSFSGEHIGWFENGWIRDNSGHCVLFTAGSNGGPVKPVRAVKPAKGVKHIRPVKGVKQVRPAKPIKTVSWSSVSGEQFFRR